MQLVTDHQKMQLIQEVSLWLASVIGVCIDLAATGVFAVSRFYFTMLLKVKL